MNRPATIIALPIVIPLSGIIYCGVASMICRLSSNPIMSSSDAEMATAIRQYRPCSPFPRLAAFQEATLIMRRIISTTKTRCPE
ncbi:hypothetical protein D3C73_1345080 [compost metagenome]